MGVVCNNGKSKLKSPESDCFNLNLHWPLGPRPFQTPTDQLESLQLHENNSTLFSVEVYVVDVVRSEAQINGLEEEVYEQKLTFRKSSRVTVGVGGGRREGVRRDCWPQWKEKVWEKGMWQTTLRDAGACPLGGQRPSHHLTNQERRKAHPRT
ncbi:hypothetical protein CEXT_157861 [Caerostris extrusa]|uniref:Uncharacterized protein n=1 Tax=Caerostris extrusa TaxID=172846 RepID=A0AAV4XTD7_CAEEX|nr:hypothetical protein CEXT_157861 [Caerostris extrusa]